VEERTSKFLICEVYAGVFVHWRRSKEMPERSIGKPTEEGIFPRLI
jgi:hypothetical protein